MQDATATKRANWLELFFDLVFVYAISKTTHVIAHPHDGHVPLASYGLFVLILVPVWWCWTGHTLLTTRFDTGDTGHHVLSLAKMLAALFLAAFIDPDFDATYHGFLAAYLALRLLLVGMYLRIARRDPRAVPTARGLALGFGVGLAVVACSLAVPSPARYVVLYLGIAIEMAAPIAMRRRLTLFPVDGHHLPERLGLLTIILLGESVVALGTTLESVGMTTGSVSAAVVGFVALAAAWRIYFVLAEERLIGRPLGHAQRLIYWHLPLYAGLAVGANFMRFAVEPALSVRDHVAMGALGLAAYLGALWVIHGSPFERGSHTRGAVWVLLVCAAALVAIAALGHDPLPGTH